MIIVLEGLLTKFVLSGVYDLKKFGGKLFLKKHYSIVKEAKQYAAEKVIDKFPDVFPSDNFADYIFQLDNQDVSEEIKKLSEGFNVIDEEVLLLAMERDLAKVFPEAKGIIRETVDFFVKCMVEKLKEDHEILRKFIYKKIEKIEDHIQKTPKTKEDLVTLKKYNSIIPRMIKNFNGVMAEMKSSDAIEKKFEFDLINELKLMQKKNNSSKDELADQIKIKYIHNFNSEINNFVDSITYNRKRLEYASNKFSRAFMQFDETLRKDDYYKVILKSFIALNQYNKMLVEFKENLSYTIYNYNITFIDFLETKNLSEKIYSSVAELILSTTDILKGKLDYFSKIFYKLRSVLSPLKNINQDFYSATLKNQKTNELIYSIFKSEEIFYDGMIIKIKEKILKEE